MKQSRIILQAATDRNRTRTRTRFTQSQETNPGRWRREKLRWAMRERKRDWLRHSRSTTGLLWIRRLNTVCCCCIRLQVHNKLVMKLFSSCYVCVCFQTGRLEVIDRFTDRESQWLLTLLWCLILVTE